MTIFQSQDVATLVRLSGVLRGRGFRVSAVLIPTEYGLAPYIHTSATNPDILAAMREVWRGS